MESSIEREDETDEVMEVPQSAVLQRLRPSRYGSVEGLDDDELADPNELELQVFIKEWAPILALPCRSEKGGIRPAVDESGGVDFGAFGTVDFERYSGGLDKARYKADKLREQLREKLIRISIVEEKVPSVSRFLVLKYLRMGIIEMEHIVNEDMRALARLWLQARQIRKELACLAEASEQRRQRQREGPLAGLVRGTRSV